MSTHDYKTIEDVTVEQQELLRQVYIRLKAEGYDPGFDYGDFIDIVFARGDHKI